MKTLLLITFSIIGLVQLRAPTQEYIHEVDDSTSISAQYYKLIDTSFWNSDEFRKEVEFCSHPAQEIYQDWNKVKIHPYKYDPGKFDDTLCIDLLSKGGCGFVSPTIGRLTSKFGWRRYRHHNGLDISLYTGQPVVSAFDGKVRIARYSPSYGYLVVVRHYNGLETLYAHLSRLKVKPGQEVEAGNLLGLGGRTGHATGSHLHFEVRFKGWSLNPADFISFPEGKLTATSIEISPDKLKHLTRYSGRKYHRVVAGEDLYSVAQKYRTKPGYLCRLNNVAPDYYLSQGEKFRVR